jgi:alcohol dehydrogenase YqhD (iron-dependent ADH family)
MKEKEDFSFMRESPLKNGVYDQVKEALKGFEVTEFWGIEANPKIETLRKAIELGKEKKVDVYKQFFEQIGLV